MFERRRGIAGGILDEPCRAAKCRWKRSSSAVSAGLASSAAVIAATSSASSKRKGLQIGEAPPRFAEFEGSCA